ncbi:MAG: hypothetical protein KBB70_01395 [Candidatus Pacebacteria bacterium]|nr:hypothetical protein [Candidatus Paceibacterota bacterium]
MERKIVYVSDTMQKKYSYELSAPMGKQFDPAFRPDLTPKQMLALGVFGGIYMRDCTKEFPEDWFTKTKFVTFVVAKSVKNKNGKHLSMKRDPKINYFKVNASQPLSVWRAKGWIDDIDPRGWFQWYCRYYMGRRLPDIDAKQIKRWKAMRRHLGQISAHCRPGDVMCRPKQRQALLHWAYDSRKV